MEVFNSLQQTSDDSWPYKLDAIDVGRRMAVERDLEKTVRSTYPAANANFAKEDCPPSTLVWDNSGNFIMYPCLLGIKRKKLLSLCF